MNQNKTMANNTAYRIIVIVFFGAVAVTVFAANFSKDLTNKVSASPSIINQREVAPITDIYSAAPTAPAVTKINETKFTRTLGSESLAAGALFVLPFIDAPEVEARVILARDLNDPVAYFSLDSQQRWPIA